jgi:DHA1 family multidrug resistance protein-like MFS transporter
MADIIRDSAFGHIVRLITKNRVFQYPEEKDLSVWESSLSVEKSAQMAVSGRIGADVDIPQPISSTSSTTQAADDTGDRPAAVGPTEKDIENIIPTDDSADTLPNDPTEKDIDNIHTGPDGTDLRARTHTSSSGPPLAELVNTISGVRVDPEKGQDVHVVDWYGPDDPEVRG